ncbi:MAG: hypothetical protein JXA18_08435 [Chitinispirillaceae bacterium]|nr:hypothetical protein [Chitinispirillaceae bacterium]
MRLLLQPAGTRRCRFTAGTCALLVAVCNYPYNPRVEPPLSETVDRGGGATRVIPINGTQQVCNPSIAQDTAHFFGCMLWLNFSGVLDVAVPETMRSFEGFSLQHDRLTIVDTSNTVRWFMKREELGADEREDFQDPEWAAHPGYIVCLLSGDAQRKWGCYAIHLLTRKKLCLCSEGLSQTSTPHLWVEPGSSFGAEPQRTHFDEDGFADSASVASFFGTSKVKVVVGKTEGNILSLHYRDYAANNRLVPLKRPANRTDWNCESPLISPDGRWTAFNAYVTPYNYEIYLQELSPVSKPILFQSGASDPHWWVHPADSSLVYIVYQEVPGDNLVRGDLADATVLATGELGITYRQMVRLFPGAATGAVTMSRIGFPEALANLPTKGGLSPDGRYLCTGYDRAFIVELP